MLEPYEGKLSRTVLREESGSNPADLLDYRPLVARLGGELIKLAPTSTHYINPLDINMNYGQEDSEDNSSKTVNPIYFKTDLIQSLFEIILAGKLSAVERSVVDQATREVYKKYLADPKPENIPILENMYDFLRTLPEKEAAHVAAALEIYVHGTLNYFNHHTNIDVNNSMVCFDIKELQKELKDMGMLIVQDAVWNRVSLNRGKGISTNYYIDEFHLLLKEPQTASYMVEIWKRFRKWGGIPTGITQNVKDLLASAEIENIFENSDFVLMLNQASGDRLILAKALNISDHQLSYVTNSNEGEGLLFFGDTVIPFVDKFPKDLELYKIMTTKPNEVTQS